MKIQISENQYKKLFEARMDGFRLDLLLSATSFKQRLAYCKQMLGFPIGNGSSRIVFQLDDYSVLKLAKNRRGVAQNLEEIRLGSEPCLSSFPEILNGTDENKGLWIISEFVLPAKEQDFQQVLKMDFKDMQRYVMAVIKCGKRGYDKFYENEKHYMFEKYEDNQDVCDLFNDILELYYDFDNLIGDLMRIENWGMVNRNGETYMVILDSGCSEEIFNNYYRRR